MAPPTSEVPRKELNRIKIEIPKAIPETQQYNRNFFGNIFFPAQYKNTPPARVGAMEKKNDTENIKYNGMINALERS